MNQPPDPPELFRVNDGHGHRIIVHQDDDSGTVTITVPVKTNATRRRRCCRGASCGGAAGRVRHLTHSARCWHAPTRQTSPGSIAKAPD